MHELANEIDIAAADWAALGFGGWPCEADRLGWQRWIAADPRHLGAYARACAVLEVAQAAAGGKDASTLVQPAFHDVEAARLLSRRRVLGGVAAAVAVSFVYPRQSGVARATEYRTLRGEQRNVTLDDGVAFTLNTQTNAILREVDGFRELHLSRGEIALTAPDRSDPLSILVDRIRILPNASELAISSLSPGRTDLIIVSGSALLQTSADRVMFARDHCIRVENGRIAKVSAISPEEQQLRLSWRQGSIDFQDVQLADAAETFARYNAVEIRFASRYVAEMRITGFFSLGRPRQFAEAVGKTLDLNVIHDDRSVTLAQP